MTIEKNDTFSSLIFIGSRFAPIGGQTSANRFNLARFYLKRQMVGSLA
jgi:hypothetical protein